MSTRAERRLDPGKIQFNDLQVGDIVMMPAKPGQKGNVTDVDVGVDVGIVKNVTGGIRVLWEDGSADRWERNSRPLVAEQVQFLNNAGQPPVNFESVILADHKKQQIVEALSQTDNHKLIFEEWGFGEIFEKGTAISLLFYGPPGTGKTLMAQAIADRYGYKLMTISTAEIETPEPGGAERNLKEKFKEAENGKTVILFDECDSLIHDRRFVGMILGAQINALLTELEHFKGIAIFTTNRLENLDEAFDRRVSLKVEFSMPEYKERIAIWQRMFPKRAPLSDDVDFTQLATIEIAGGHIKNVVIKAARKAAMSQDKQITMDILVDCLEAEIESKEAFNNALENGPKYGKRLTLNHQAQLKRAVGMTRIGG